MRLTSEYADGHIPGAISVPLHELPQRLNEVVPRGEVWVHCATGYRASIATSLLTAKGRQPVLIDDEFANAAGAGMPIEQACAVHAAASARSSSRCG